MSWRWWWASPGCDGGKLDLLRTMRRRPRLLGGNDRRRTPRAMPGKAHMHSIVRVLVGVHPVLIGCRDEERRPPVQLRLVPLPGRSLPSLRPRQHLLLAALQRPVPASVGAPCRAALPGQPPGPSQACRAPAALPRTPAAPGAGRRAPCAESDASPFDRRASASCCDAHAGGAVRNPAVRARPSRQGVPLRTLRAVLRPHGLSGPAPGAKGVRWRSTSRPGPRSCGSILPRSGGSARSRASSASITARSSARWRPAGRRCVRSSAGCRRSIRSGPSSARPWRPGPGCPPAGSTGWRSPFRACSRKPGASALPGCVASCSRNRMRLSRGTSPVGTRAGLSRSCAAPVVPCV